jgi:hypothetical protein
MLYDVEDKEYPSEWTYDDNGYPMCTAFRERGTKSPAATAAAKKAWRTIKSRWAVNDLFPGRT